MFTVADYSESSRRTQPRKRLRRMRECQYRSLGCNAVLNRHAIKLHVSECDYQPPAKMPKPTLDSFTQLIGHCKKHLGFQIVQVLKDWANLTMPAVHTELSVVPDVPVYVDSNRLWDKPLPPHPQVLEDIRAQLYRDEPLFQEENAILLGQMVDGSMHRPAEALRGSLDLKPTRNILSQYGFTLPPELAEIGVKKSLFDVSITPSFRVTDIHLDSGDTLYLPLYGHTVILLFKPEPAPSKENSVSARQEKWYHAWVKRFLAAQQEENDRNSWDWFLSLAPDLCDPYMANLSKSHGKALWIPAGWRYVVFTLRSSFLGCVTFVPKQHLGRVVSQLLDECQAAAKWGADPTDEAAKARDFLHDALWGHLHANVASALHALKTSLKDKDYHQGAKGLFETLHDGLSRTLPSLLRDTAIAECQRLCDDGKQEDSGEWKDGKKRKDDGERKDGGKRRRT